MQFFNYYVIIFFLAVKFRETRLETTTTSYIQFSQSKCDFKPNLTGFRGQASF